MIVVGVRKFKLQLGRYLKIVKEGGSVIITDRGRPIAEVAPIKKSDEDRNVIIREMAMSGEVTWHEFKRPVEFHPPELHGNPLSEQIIEDRADRL